MGDVCKIAKDEKRCADYGPGVFDCLEKLSKENPSVYLHHDISAEFDEIGRPLAEYYVHRHGTPWMLHSLTGARWLPPCGEGQSSPVEESPLQCDVYLPR